MKTEGDTKTTPNLITTADLAQRWKVTPMTLRRWRRDGKLQAYHLGRGIRFSAADIEKIEAESKD